jgi:hypothetical protein
VFHGAFLPPDCRVRAKPLESYKKFMRNLGRTEKVSNPVESFPFSAPPYPGAMHEYDTALKNVL